MRANLSNDEMMNIVGGGITATLLNAVSRLVSTVLNLGQTIGSSLRRITSNSVCKL